jgi:hypothetical protein
MKCEQCRPLLAALSGGDLAKEKSERCRAHIAGCTSCAQELRELRDTVALLRRVGQSEPLPAEFTASLHRRLAATPPPEKPLFSRLWGVLERLGLDSGPRLGFSVSVAGLLGVLLLSPVPPRRASESATPAYAPEQEVAAAFRVPSRRVAVVHLDFVADVPVDDVEFEVTLPSGLNFMEEGKPVAERTLQWRGSLAPGRNPIPLAVRGIKPGRYRVTAQARGSGIEVRHDILLEVVPS